MNVLKAHSLRSNASKKLPDIWLKASMLGSLWASVEIILGSFLHNLHMPFSGTFLASLGVIIMINGYKLWPEKGLLWRTALVTAAMKSISPSAIIFGPMVGIFMEGVILEICLRMFRGRWPGFILGGAIAVSWSLFQKIFVMLMTYGPDFVKLYEQLYFMAARSLQLQGTVPFDLVKAIFVVDLCFGALVAILAYRTNSKHDINAVSNVVESHPDVKPENQLTASLTQKYSATLFFVNLLVLVSGLYVIDSLSLLQGGVLVLVYVTLNIFRYNRSLKRLKRPQLWIQLIAVMGLSGLLLGGWDSQSSILNGLSTGVGMATRALLVIFGFSALSIEIRNPTIISWFTRRGMGIAFDALSLAFEVLPRLVKLVADKKRIWRHPFRTLNQLLGALEILRKEHTTSRPKVIILSGNQGDGKTERIKSLLNGKGNHSLTFSGFYSEGSWVNNERDSYRIVDITSLDSEPLCGRNAPVSGLKAGPFFFLESGLEFGCTTLSAIATKPGSVVIIDEVGHLELQSKGWSECMDGLLAREQVMIWTVRPSLLDAVVAKWGLHALVIDVKTTTVGQLLESIHSFFDFNEMK